MIAQIIIASIMAVLGILVLAGKGDTLIAGYNTAPKEDQESKRHPTSKRWDAFFLL